MEQQETIAVTEQETEIVPAAEPEQQQKKEKRPREVVSVREGRFHAWVRTIAIVGIFAAFALFFLYLAPQVATVLSTADDALKNADKAVTDVAGTIESANTIIAGLEDTMEDTDALVDEARGAIGHLDTIAGQLEDANLTETFDNLNTAVEDFTAVIGPLASFFR